LTSPDAEPPHQLRGFSKVRLPAGEGTTVTFHFSRGDLAAFEEGTGEWTVHDGRYEILVGRSSRDLHVWAAVDVIAGQLAQTAR
jgi:beta-glucosidase